MRVFTYCERDHSDGNVCLAHLTAAGICPNEADHATPSNVALPHTAPSGAGIAEPDTRGHGYITLVSSGGAWQGGVRL